VAIARALGARLWRGRFGPVGIRVGLASVVIAAVCVAQLSATSSSGAADTFVPGNATATASGIELASSVGQLNASIILGTSQADYEVEVGQALSQTLDLGLVGDVLEAPSCSTGAPSATPASDFPQPIQAESTNGNQSLHAVAEDSLRGLPAGVGDEYAAATTQPSGNATTTIASDDLAGLVNVLGSTTNASAALVNGNTRTASSTADISSLSLANGLVVIKGLHWQAAQTSGSSTSTGATFAIGGLTVAGVNVPVSNAEATGQVTSLIQIINTALLPSGFHIQWPTETVLNDGTDEISPLIVGIDNSALGQELVGANLSKVQTVRQELLNELFGLNCNIPGYVEVADIALSVLEGGGDLDIDLGGARAVTNDIAGASPFTVTAGGGLLGGLGIGTGASTDSSSFSAGIPAIPGTPATVLPAGTTTTTTGSSGQKVSLGALTKSMSCNSIGPAGGGCNHSNMALPVGLIGLTLLVGLAAWDYVRQQRRRNRLRGLEAL
jgi:hypothetical protein